MRRILMICCALLILLPASASAQKSRKAPEPPPPAGPAGLYVLCSKKTLPDCPALVAAFQEQFPIGQPGPYLMLKSDGSGYLAPDDRYTVSVSWQIQEGDGLLLSIKDSRKSKLELRKNGPQLLDLKNGDVYQLARTEQELNPEAKPFRQTWEKQQREQRK